MTTTFACGSVRVSVHFHYYQLNAPERGIANFITFTFACSILQESKSEISRREHWKISLMFLHKIVRNRLSNVRQMCDSFAHPSYDVRNEIRAIFRKLSGQFAAHLRQQPPPPPRERPLLGISGVENAIMCDSTSYASLESAA